MNVLDTIIAYKKTQLRRQKAELTIAQMEASELYSRKTKSLKNTLGENKKTGIIAEFKRRSPSKDTINAKANVFTVTEAYTKHGASGISVLTDEKFFGGSNADLVSARPNKIPILRKDFIIDEYQVVESKYIGADVILLIAAVLSPQVVKNLAAFAKELGLEILLEIHEEKELDHICDDIDIVGINNRNLKSFEVDINTSLNLIKKIPSGKLVITESGIADVETIVTLRNAGFKGFLIGETFMKAADPTIAFAEFVQNLKAKQ